MIEQNNKAFKQNQCFLISGCYIDSKAIFHINYLFVFCYLQILWKRIMAKGFFFLVFIFSNFKLKMLLILFCIF